MSRQRILALGLASLALLLLGLTTFVGTSPTFAQEAKTTPPAAKAKDAHAPAAADAHGAADAPHGEEHASGDPDVFEPQPSLVIWTVVVFLGLLFVLGKFAWKPLLSALHVREEHLEHVLQDTERARNEGEALLAEHRRRLAATEEQIRAMILEAKQNAQTIADDIIKQAEAAAEAAKQRATKEIGTARDQALSEIWSKTADLAVSVAGKVLSKSVGGDEHHRLIEMAINELPSAPNGQTVGGRTA